MKCFLFRFFRSQDIQIVVFLSTSLFPTVSHYSRRWSSTRNLKVYAVINWLKKNLKTHFVGYLEKESRSDIETWSIDRVLNKEQFYGKTMQKMRSKH